MTRQNDHPQIRPFCVTSGFCFAVSPRKRRSNKTAGLQGKDRVFEVAEGLVTATLVTL